MWPVQPLKKWYHVNGNSLIRGEKDARIDLLNEASNKSTTNRITSVNSNK